MSDELDYKKLIEAALFMSPSPLSIQDLSNITGLKSVGYLEKAIGELTDDYKNRDSSLEVVEIDKRYMLSVKEPYAGRVSSLSSGPDITKGSLKLLAYISRNNNTLQSGLVKIFGTSTYDHMKELLEQGFVERRKTGRSMRVSVTNKFKEYFNVPTQ